MMKRFFLLFLTGLLTLTANAEILDAFRSAQPFDAAQKGIWPVTDPSYLKSLNGEWQLKVVRGVTSDKTVPASDKTWGRIPVPGCWEAYGFCEPKYNYPDSLTGYYRTEFTVPRTWKGQRVIVRFDGVLRGYNLWLNNQLVGTWESGYNTCLFDLTPFLTAKAFDGEPQQLAMRVYSHFKGYEFDCFDDWATMGIFRDVTLFPVPETHLSDFRVETEWIDGNKASVRFDVTVANPQPDTYIYANVFHPTDGMLYDSDFTPQPVDEDGHCSFRVEDEQALLWTAETPWLYQVDVCVCKGKEMKQVTQFFRQKFGVRQISIDGNILKLNGKPIKLRGVNAHSTDPRTVKVISEELTLKDMKLMKEASVNYMRLSHYPREPRFYELADSLGFYLVSEVPFGFGDKHLGSRSYQDILKTRALATVTRDKNHPSVIVWSVGNENPLPQTCVEVGDYVYTLDPWRPYCFPQVGSYFRKFWEKKEHKQTDSQHSTVNTQHSASPFPSEAPVYAPHYPTTSQIGGFYQHLDRPVIFTEYCHTLGISFEDHDRQWEIIERTPGIAGGSVWEWADQGMPFAISKNKSKTFSRWRKDGSEADQQVYTSEEGGFGMHGNYGTDGLLYADRTPLPNYYELQHNYARAFVSQQLVSTFGPDNRYTVLSIKCHNRYDFLNLEKNVRFYWTMTNNRDTVAQNSFSISCPPRSEVDYTMNLPKAEGLSMVHFDIRDREGRTFLRQTLLLRKPQVAWTGSKNTPLPIQEVTVRAGRKPTMAERIIQKNRLPRKYLLSLDGTEVKAHVRRSSLGVGEEVSFTLLPDTADVFRAELGLACLLDSAIDRVQWIGQGPFASYPGRHQACRYGIWAMHRDDLYFEGNHMGVDAAYLSDKDGNGILIVGDSLNLNFEQTDRGIVLTVNAAVSGQGPKFAKTAFPGWKRGDGPVGATFRCYPIKGEDLPVNICKLFVPASDVPAPFQPFLTQYDTYLLRYETIK